MYSQQYYEERKVDLEKDFNESKEKYFAKFIQLAEEWKGEATKTQQKFQELLKREEEAKKQNDEAAKPKEIKK